MGKTYNLLPFIELSRRCVHCQRRVRTGGRGLCRHCHNDLSIRSRYKPIVNTRPNLGKPEEVYLPSGETISAAKKAIRDDREKR